MSDQNRSNVSTNIGAQSGVKKLKTIPKGYRSHESAKRKSPDSKSFFIKRDQSRSPKRMVNIENDRVERSIPEIKLDYSDVMGEDNSEEKIQTMRKSEDMIIDPTILYDDEEADQPTVDTSDFKWIESADLCGHEHVVETDGIIVCKTCNCQLYLEEETEADGQCAHSNITKDKGTLICEDCGTELYEEISHEQEWRHFSEPDGRGGMDMSRGHFRRAPERGIKKELEQRGFAPDICERANHLYAEITQGDIKRLELRRGIAFAAVFEAHKQLGRPVIPEEIKSRFFNLERKAMSQGLSYFRLKCPKTYFQFEDISVKHFIPGILGMPQFNAKQEHIDRVIALYERIEDKCAILNRSNPQSVSKAIIYYYFRRMGVKISPSRYGRIVGISIAVLLRLSSAISQVLGTAKNVALV